MPWYLRITHGPDCLPPENLSRPCSGGLGAKRPLTLREFAPGLEGPERFATHGEPPRRMHKRVFGVKAQESEPVDPRL